MCTSVWGTMSFLLLGRCLGEFLGYIATPKFDILLVGLSVCLFFETQSHNAAKAGPEFTTLLPQLPSTGITVCVVRFKFLNCKTVFHDPHQQRMSFQFLYHTTLTFACNDFCTHPGGCTVACPSGFDIHSLTGQSCQALFHVLLASCVFSAERCLLKSFAHF